MAHKTLPEVAPASTFHFQLHLLPLMSTSLGEVPAIPQMYHPLQLLHCVLPGPSAQNDFCQPIPTLSCLVPSNSPFQTQILPCLRESHLFGVRHPWESPASFRHWFQLLLSVFSLPRLRFLRKVKGILLCLRFHHPTLCLVYGYISGECINK